MSKTARGIRGQLLARHVAVLVRLALEGRLLYRSPEVTFAGFALAAGPPLARLRAIS